MATAAAATLPTRTNAFLHHTWVTFTTTTMSLLHLISPLAVATIVARYGMDATTIMAALLHDAVEDTPMSLADVREQFGDDVALLVDGVTKLDRIDFESKAEQQAASIRKMIIAMATLTSASRTAIRMIPPAMPKMPEMKEVISVVARMMVAANAVMRAQVR